MGVRVPMGTGMVEEWQEILGRYGVVRESCMIRSVMEWYGSRRRFRVIWSGTGAVCDDIK